MSKKSLETKAKTSDPSILTTKMKVLLSKLKHVRQLFMNLEWYELSLAK